MEYLLLVDWASFAAGVMSLLPLLVWAFFRKRPVREVVKLLYRPYTYEDFRREVRGNTPIAQVVKKCGGKLPYRHR